MIRYSIMSEVDNNGRVGNYVEVTPKTVSLRDSRYIIYIEAIKRVQKEELKGEKPGKSLTMILEFR